MYGCGSEAMLAPPVPRSPSVRFVPIEGIVSHVFSSQTQDSLIPDDAIVETAMPQCSSNGRKCTLSYSTAILHSGLRLEHLDHPAQGWWINFGIDAEEKDPVEVVWHHHERIQFNALESIG